MVPRSFVAEQKDVDAIARATREIGSDLIQLRAAKLEQQRTMLRRRIKRAETKIDQLVFRLYELTKPRSMK